MTPELSAFIRFLARLAVEQYLAETKRESSAVPKNPNETPLLTTQKTEKNHV